MPLVRISLKRGKSQEYRAALMDGVYAAMLETFNVPADDRFIIVEELDGDNFSFSKTYLGIERSDDLVIIQITANNTRTLEQKKAFFAAVAANLAKSPSLRKEDVFINLVEAPKENWSFGNGVAQYA